MNQTIINSSRRMSLFYLLALIALSFSCVFLCSGCKKSEAGFVATDIYHFSWGWGDSCIFYIQSEENALNSVLFRYDISKKQSEKILAMPFKSNLSVFPGNRRVLVRNKNDYMIIDVERKTIAPAFSLLNDVYSKTGNYTDNPSFQVYNESSVFLEVKRDNKEYKEYDVLSYNFSSKKINRIIQRSLGNYFADDRSGIYYHHFDTKDAFHYSIKSGKSIQLRSMDAEGLQKKYMNEDIILFGDFPDRLFRITDKQTISLPNRVYNELPDEMKLSPEMRYMTRGEIESDVPWEITKPSIYLFKTDDYAYKWLVENSVPTRMPGAGER